MSRSIYLVRPDWDGDPDDVHESVVEALLNGPRYIEVAIELWRLVDDEIHAAQINALTLRAFGRERRDLSSSEIKEFLQLIEDLDEIVKKTWLDDKWRIPPERLAEVRRRTTLLDLDDNQGHWASEGISEGLGQVAELREFLKQALDRGLHLALD